MPLPGADLPSDMVTLAARKSSGRPISTIVRLQNPQISTLTPDLLQLLPRPHPMPDQSAGDGVEVRESSF
jgi:hypothetical protein